MNEKLEGRNVLVHPDLHNDPAGKTGQTGTIRSVDIHGNDFFVEFPDGKLGRYGGDALLVIRKSEAIHQVLERDKGTLSLADRKSLFNLTLFQRFGFPEQLHKALEMAKQSAVIRDLGFESLEQSLAVKEVRARSR